MIKNQFNCTFAQRAAFEAAASRLGLSLDAFFRQAALRVLTEEDCRLGETIARAAQDAEHSGFTPPSAPAEPAVACFAQPGGCSCWPYDANGGAL